MPTGIQIFPAVGKTDDGYQARIFIDVLGHLVPVIKMNETFLIAEDAFTVACEMADELSDKAVQDIINKVRLSTVGAKIGH